MTVAEDLLHRHLETLVADNARWQTLIAEDVVWELPWIAAVFDEAGWTVKSEGVASFGPVLGLSIVLRRGETPPPYADVVREAVETGFGAVRVRDDPNADQDPVVLLVGSKAAE